MTQGDATYLVRSQGEFTNLDDIRNVVVMTRDGVPIYLRDIAEVVDSTEDRRQFLQIDGKPGVRMQVNKQTGENTVAVAAGIRTEVERINREVPGIRVLVTNDQAVFIERAINNVQEHAWWAAFSLCSSSSCSCATSDRRSSSARRFRCRSSARSRCLFFGGFTLNTMTFGGLASGIGMIVDAAIVVLENTHRHLHMGKDRMTAAIDGSEEVWSAILASTLTHIAVFIPLLFLTGISSVLFGQLSIVVIFSLAMSLFVAVTIVPGALLALAAHARRGSGPQRTTGPPVPGQRERCSKRVDERYRKALHVALAHRPTIIGGAVASVVAAVLIYPLLSTELLPQTDEGEVNVNAELPIGTRIERTEAVMLQLEEMVRQTCRRPRRSSRRWRRRRIRRLWRRHQPGHDQYPAHPARFDATRTSDQIAQELRRQLSGLPGVMVRANPSPVATSS